MNIEVLLFAAVAQKVGVEKLRLNLPDNATIDDALSILIEQHPGLSAYKPVLATAVNHEYVGTDHRLCEGDELALIPPVSGG